MACVNCAGLQLKGDGDLNAAAQVVASMLTQYGYNQDLKRYISTIVVEDDLRHPDGTIVAGYCPGWGTICVNSSSSFPLEVIIKHELGHAKHGSSEELAERYEDFWF